MISNEYHIDNFDVCPFCFGQKMVVRMDPLFSPIDFSGIRVFPHWMECPKCLGSGVIEKPVRQL